MTPLLVPSRRAAQVITIADLSFLTDPAWTRAEIRRDYPDARSLARSARRRRSSSCREHVGGGSAARRSASTPAKIAVVPAGAPAVDAATRAAPRDGYVLFVGTLEPRKNVGVLLDAFESLSRWIGPDGRDRQ